MQSSELSTLKINMALAQNESKYEYLFKLELRGKPIPDTNQGKIAVLNKRRKKVSYLILANFAFILIFFISSSFGATNLSTNWLIGLAIVFSLNILLQYKQASSIKEAISYYSEN